MYSKELLPRFLPYTVQVVYDRLNSIHRDIGVHPVEQLQQHAGGGRLGPGQLPLSGNLDLYDHIRCLLHSRYSTIL